MVKIKLNNALIKTKSPIYIGLFCTLLLFISCTETNTPAETTRLFWNALITNDLKKAQSYVPKTSNQLESIDPYLDLQNTHIKIGEIRINDLQATVQTLFTYQQNQKPDMDITTYLVKKNNIWKIDYQKTSRMFPGKAFMDLMQSLENLSQSYKKKLEEQVPLIEEKIESINEQLIEKIDELNRQLQKPEATEKQKPSMQSI